MCPTIKLKSTLTCVQRSCQPEPPERVILTLLQRILLCLCVRSHGSGDQVAECTQQVTPCRAQELDAAGGPHADAREELQELKDEFARRLGAADRSVAALRVSCLPRARAGAPRLQATDHRAAVQCGGGFLLSVPAQGETVIKTPSHGHLLR